MLADVAEITVDDEIGRQHIGDLAGRGAALPPQPDRHGRHAETQNQKHRNLETGGPCMAPPGAAGALAPSADHVGEARILARLGSEALHHGIAGDGIRKRSAHARVPGIGEARGGRDPARREQHRQDDVKRAARRHQHAHDRPVRGHQHHRSDEHDEGRQKREQQRVVQRVERPHAARDLAHGRSGEAVGVPVRRKALDAVEGVLPDLGHDAERERNNALPGQLAQDQHGKAEHRHAGECPKRRAERRVARGSGGCERIDDLAREHRNEDIGKCGGRDRRGDETGAQRLPPPMAEGEGKHGSDRIGARPAALWGHGVFSGTAMPAHLSADQEPIGPANAEIAKRMKEGQKLGPCPEVRNLNGDQVPGGRCTQHWHEPLPVCVDRGSN